MLQTYPIPVLALVSLSFRVTACGICGSDLKMVGQTPSAVVIAHEFAGEMVAVGADAADRFGEGVLVSPPS